jgi:3-hydroxybutyryl-CoA dehydrogenase
MTATVVVCGAGTMGRGIALVSARAGLHTVLFDLDAKALRMSMEYARQRLARDSGDRTPEEVLSRIVPTTDIHSCIGDVVIEAIAEDVGLKSSLFNQLAEINHSDTVFATNTSSLSVSAIADKVQHPDRVCGMHFFNPAPAMRLVEVVRGRSTRTDVVDAVMDLARRMDKTPVLCSDSPGFIVNRVARQYYLESMRLLENGACDIETIDSLMESCGFRMGPFRLMDLIGNDINYAVSGSLYEALGRPERLKPSGIQKAKVESGELGRKTGRGFYDYPPVEG